MTVLYVPWGGGTWHSRTESPTSTPPTRAADDPFWMRPTNLRRERERAREREIEREREREIERERARARERDLEDAHVFIPQEREKEGGKERESARERERGRCLAQVVRMTERDRGDRKHCRRVFLDPPHEPVGQIIEIARHSRVDACIPAQWIEQPPDMSSSGAATLESLEAYLRTDLPDNEPRLFSLLPTSGLPTPLPHQLCVLHLRP